jgi:hypothetical protein
MPCQGVTLPGGGHAIVCTGRGGKKCPCGNRATLLCDWKDKRKLGATCDKPLCARCTTSPAPDKDLCPKHAAEWAQIKAAKP